MGWLTTTYLTDNVGTGSVDIKTAGNLYWLRTQDATGDSTSRPAVEGRCLVIHNALGTRVAVGKIVCPASGDCEAKMGPYPAPASTTTSTAAATTPGTTATTTVTTSTAKATTKATTAPTTAATASPSAPVFDQGCEVKSSGYLSNSPGFVETAALCSELCEASTQCNSMTWYESTWCSHFSTACATLVPEAGATTVRFQPVARSVGWNLIGCSACSISDGEKYLGSSPGQGVALAQCLQECEKSSSGCKSITVYADGYCSHFSTECRLTTELAKAITFRIVHA